MKSRFARIQTFSATLLLLAIAGQAVVGCSDDPPPADRDASADASSDAKPDAKPDATPDPDKDGGPDAPAPKPDADAGPDADASDADANPGPTVVSLRSVSVTPSVKKAAKGTIILLKVEGTYTDGRVVGFKPADLDLTVAATLIASGTDAYGSLALDARKAGKTTVTVTHRETGVKGSADIEVTDAALKTLQLTAREGKLAKGLFQDLTATGLFDDGSQQDVTLQAKFAADPSEALEAVAGPANNGRFKTVKEGKVDVTATFAGKEGKASFTIDGAAPKALAFKAPPAKMALRTITSLTAEATLTDDTTSPITQGATWSSSNPQVLLVDNLGLVTAANLGTANITVTTANGVSATTTITVAEASLETVRLSAFSGSGTIEEVPVLKTRRLGLFGELSDQTIQNLTDSASWESSDADTLSVDNGQVKGLLTAKKEGEATITAKFGDKSYTAKIKVVAAAR
jgi:hypothetical protein